MADKSLTKKGQKTKKTLLNAALNLIYERQSVDSVSVRDIAKRTGLTGSIITYHFATKNALLDEIGKLVMERCKYNPLGEYYEAHKQNLDDKNLQREFILGMVEYFYDYFKNIPREIIKCNSVQRVLAKSPEFKSLISIASFQYDMLSFCKIYEHITGDKDTNHAYYIFMASFEVLGKRLLDPNRIYVFSDDCRISEDFEDYAIKEIQVRLLRDLGL
ncbi:MAG: helix-turn-helix transcriptional regulator [Lentisphaeria bacterium]|nr:helix-turn-helix transcriptional regulator [Lentisphaeria bacterium]